MVKKMKTLIVFDTEIITFSSLEYRLWLFGRVWFKVPGRLAKWLFARNPDLIVKRISRVRMTR